MGSDDTKIKDYLLKFFKVDMDDIGYFQMDPKQSGVYDIPLQDDLFYCSKKNEFQATLPPSWGVGGVLNKRACASLFVLVPPHGGLGGWGGVNKKKAPERVPTKNRRESSITIDF